MAGLIPSVQELDALRDRFARRDGVRSANADITLRRRTVSRWMDEEVEWRTAPPR